MSAPVDRKEKFLAILRVSSGNFLEMYDFFIFAYVAKQIGDTFFPGGSDFIKLMAAFSTFAVGFMMRPLGAIILGAYIDHVGRRKGLIVTLGLMSLGTLSLAVTPGYETIGILAPIIIVCGRLLQGFSAGVELGGVSVYLSEIATPGNKGFYVAWQSGSQQVAVILAALLGILLNYYLPADLMKSWGWRIPLFVGCLIVPFIFVLRASLKETEEFASRKRHPTLGEIYRSTFANFGLVICGMLLVLTTTVLFYFITAYTPTFGKEVLKLSALDALTVTLCVAVSNLFWLPTIGALSDRIGRTPILIFCTVMSIISAYPALSWLIAAPSFGNLMVVELWLSFVYAAYNGAMVVYLTEIMPVAVRTAGFSLAYSLATCFGGLTPLIATWLINETGNRAAAGWWLSIAGVLSLLAVLAAMGFKFAHRAAAGVKTA
ncbi:citrate-proton symporter [Aliidongia dinghuensis]|uniref:Citrate-proton symporter n=1 Tax=Aliidongia dinghuensis TaxID=1867774 RepID=A0A8J2YQX3_9PROT|nr:MFS transporter [Aliidongia dinghuensis]GGF10137.1 citrate-proton symporter [Aliidongia dinghuensis]